MVVLGNIPVKLYCPSPAAHTQPSTAAFTTTQATSDPV
jgi:hypothetical protein